MWSDGSAPCLSSASIAAGAIVLGGEDERRLAPLRLLARWRWRPCRAARRPRRRLPDAAAKCSAVAPLVVVAFASAPALSSAVTTAALPALARDVQRRVAADARRRLHVRRARLSSASAIAESPCSAAQCSAVMPSPCGDVHVGALRDQLLHRGRVAASARRRRPPAYVAGGSLSERDLRACVLLLRECRSARREQQRRGHEQADSFHARVLLRRLSANSPVLSPKLFMSSMPELVHAATASRSPSACRPAP